eukprot:jgi/Chrzof1/3474/Cz12g26260.t1
MSRSVLDDLGEEITGIAAPVSICMALTVLLVRVLNPEGQTSSSTVVIASIAYAEQAGDSAGQKLGGALLNAVIFICVVAGMTFVLFLLFKYKCYKLIYGYMGFAVFNIFFFLTGGIMINLLQVTRIHMDAFSLCFILLNFSVVGVCSLFFMPAPLLLKQCYLVWVGIITAYIFTYIPEWTSWVLLVMMAVYDLVAVLLPGGPLKILVELAIEREQELPALIYEARPVGRPYQRGHWGRRNQEPGMAVAPTEAGATADGSPSRVALLSAGGGADAELGMMSSSASSSPGIGAHPRPRPLAEGVEYPQQGSMSATSAGAGALPSGVELTTSPGQLRGKHGFDLPGVTQFGRPIAEGSEVPASQRSPGTGDVATSTQGRYQTEVLNDSGVITVRGLAPIRTPSGASVYHSVSDGLETGQQMSGDFGGNGAHPGGVLEPVTDISGALLPGQSGESQVRLTRSTSRQRAVCFAPDPAPTSTNHHMSDRSDVAIPISAGVNNRVHNRGNGMQRPEEAEAGEDEEGFGDLPDSIKLGLGDFIFYSMLVGRAAMYDMMTVYASYLAIVAGLGITLLLLALARKALPALPVSIALGVVFYFLTRLVLEPFVVPLGLQGAYY